MNQILNARLNRTSGINPLRKTILVAATILSLNQHSALAQHDGHDHGDHSHAPDPHAAESHTQKYPFEWGGVYALPEGVVDLVVQPGPDESIDIALVSVSDESEPAFDAAVAQAAQTFSGQPKPVHPGGELAPGTQFFQLRVEQPTEMRFKMRVEKAGRYALFTQHFADEFQTIFVSQGNKIHPSASRNMRDRFGQIVIQPSAVKAFGVKIATVGLHTLDPSFIAPARVAYDAERMAHIGSAVVGRVAALPVRLGDWVKAGDTLVIIDSPELGEAQNEYLQRRTLAQTAAPLVEIARSAHERARSFYEESQGISLTEVQKRQAELQVAESALFNARAAMTGSLNRLHLLGMTEQEIETLAQAGIIAPKYTIRAPIDGQIIRREITLGELVRPDQDSLLVLADTTSLWVLADVPEMRLKDIAIGSVARTTMAAFPGESLDGHVSLISTELNESTRTVQVRVEFNNASGQLRPGMFAQVELSASMNGAASEKNDGVLAVPDSAVQTVEGKPVVFVPFDEKPNTFLKRPVTLGESVGGMWPVLYGLREGEPIVVAATFILKAELGKSSAKHEH